MITHRHVRQYIGQHIHCHTHFGTFQGVIVHMSKHHVILAHAGTRFEEEMYPVDYDMMRGAPYGPGPGPGPGTPPPPGPGGGWHMAIPIAAILGITAVGMHWW